MKGNNLPNELSTTPFYSAGVANAADSGAVIIKDGNCGSGHLLPVLGCYMITQDMVAVKTPSGNQEVSCHFDIPPGCTPLAKPVKANGFECYTSFSIATDTSFVATPGGQATLKCRVGHSAPPKR